jgi:DNA-binding MarR family transcriptional regulator
MLDLESKALELKKSLDVISAHFQAINAAGVSGELSLQELKIVDYLGQRESCIMREMAEHSQVAVSTMTGIIDKLEGKDLVKRERNDEDRRIVRVQLTNKGQKVYQSNVENYLELSRRMLESLDKDEQDIYLEITRKIARNTVQHVSTVSGK